MTMLMAIAFFVAGGICLTKPASIVEWLVAKASKTRKNSLPLDALRGPGVALFIRVIGFLALINGVTMLFVASMPAGAG